MSQVKGTFLGAMDMRLNNGIVGYVSSWMRALEPVDKKITITLENGKTRKIK